MRQRGRDKELLAGMKRLTKGIPSDWVGPNWAVEVAPAKLMIDVDADLLFHRTSGDMVLPSILTPRGWERVDLLIAEAREQTRQQVLEEVEDEVTKTLQRAVDDYTNKSIKLNKVDSWARSLILRAGTGSTVDKIRAACAREVRKILAEEWNLK